MIFVKIHSPAARGSVWGSGITSLSYGSAGLSYRVLERFTMHAQYCWLDTPSLPFHPCFLSCPFHRPCHSPLRPDPHGHCCQPPPCPNILCLHLKPPEPRTLLQTPLTKSAAPHHTPEISWPPSRQKNGHASATPHTTACIIECFPIEKTQACEPRPQARLGPPAPSSPTISALRCWRGPPEPGLQNSRCLLLSMDLQADTAS